MLALHRRPRRDLWECPLTNGRTEAVASSLGTNRGDQRATSDSSDEEDDVFIETAVIGEARYLVSEDAHLRENAVKRHLDRHGIRVLYPKQFRKSL